MRQLLAMTVALLVVLGSADIASAADGGPGKYIHNTTAALGMGLSVIGIGIGLGLIGHAALSGIARQPEQAGAIQGVMFIIAGLVEGAGIIALVLCLVTIFV